MVNPRTITPNAMVPIRLAGPRRCQRQQHHRPNYESQQPAPGAGGHQRHRQRRDSQYRQQPPNPAHGAIRKTELRPINMSSATPVMPPDLGWDGPQTSGSGQTVHIDVRLPDW